MSRRELVRCAAYFCLILVTSQFASAGDVNDRKHARVRIAASTSLVGDVNMNDARAAMRSWADAIVRQAGMEIEPNALISSDELIEHARRGTVDGVGITLLEYMRMAPYLDQNLLLVDQSYAPGGGLEYLLLVPEESGIRSIADLHDTQVAITNSAEMCLAPAWLETVLRASNLASSDKFFRGVVSVPKLSRAVLPVFFRQMDACIVTRHGFTVMCEMNPQLARKLRVLLVSPRLVPMLFAFHKDFPADRKMKLKDAMLALPLSVVGKQIMMMFQAQGTSVANASMVKPSVDLVIAAQRIRGRNFLSQGKKP